MARRISGNDLTGNVSGKTLDMCKEDCKRRSNCQYFEHNKKDLKCKLLEEFNKKQEPPIDDSIKFCSKIQGKYISTNR